MLRNFVPEKETLFQQEFVPKDSSFYNKKHHRRKSEDLNQEFILRYYVKRMQNWRKERLTRGENIIWKTQFMFILLAFIIWSGSSIKGKGEQTRPIIHKHVYRKKMHALFSSHKMAIVHIRAIMARVGAFKMTDWKELLSRGGSEYETICVCVHKKKSDIPRWNPPPPKKEIKRNGRPKPVVLSLPILSLFLVS